MKIRKPHILTVFVVGISILGIIFAIISEKKRWFQKELHTSASIKFVYIGFEGNVWKATIGEKIACKDLPNMSNIFCKQYSHGWFERYKNIFWSQEGTAIFAWDIPPKHNDLYPKAIRQGVIISETQPGAYALWYTANPMYAAKLYEESKMAEQAMKGNVVISQLRF